MNDVKPKPPPNWLLRFFRWFCHPDFQEDIEGDLLEMYEWSLHEKSRSKANWIFFWEIISLIKLNLIRPLKNSYSTIQMHMYKNYFKIAWRSLLRQKLYSFLNIGGLAIGLASFIMVWLYVQHELSYDLFYPDQDRLYRVYQRQIGSEYMSSDYFAVTPAVFAPTLMKEFPEIETATSLADRNFNLLTHKKDNYWEKGFWVGPRFFEVFQHNFLKGNPEAALRDPFSIVLTQSLAKKMFGLENPIGQNINLKNDANYTVTGVIEDLPSNSSLKFTFIADLTSDDSYNRDIKEQSWNSSSYQTFFLFKKGANHAALEQKILRLAKKYVDEEEAETNRFFVQPISDLHLQTGINFDIGLKGNMTYVYLFSFVAILVLLLACVNYMNLAIARSMKRAREVGLRKVIGALRGQLIGQFLSESILIAFLALVSALALIPWLLPIFGHLLDRSIQFDFIGNPWLIPSLVALVIIVGIFSGSYPAFFMSSLNPVQVLKGQVNRKFAKLRLQQWLIVGQYAASTALIISSIIIYQQFQFIQNKELGYNTEHILTIRVRDASLRDKYEVMKEEWLKQPEILQVSTAHELPTNIDSQTLVSPTEKGREDLDVPIYHTSADENFLPVFGIKLITGRNFSKDFSTDVEKASIWNRKAVKALGWTPEEAIGKTFTRGEKTYTIVGVVEDFHMHSFHLAIKPLMLFAKEDLARRIAVKVHPENLPQTIAKLEKSFQEYSPFPFEYNFMDDKFDELYQADIRLGEIFGFFTILSILIASLGLFGLAAYSAERRTKEIGIRKVLGATVQNIVGILAKDFIKMVLLGFLIAIPIAWYFMQQWLADFVYRIEISWWMFALAGFFAMLITFLSVGFQSLKAAFANPVDSLRNE